MNSSRDVCGPYGGDDSLIEQLTMTTTMVLIWNQI